MAPAPRKGRKRYRGQKQTERKREEKADGGEDRWDKREKEMKAERTWGGEDGGEEGYTVCSQANENRKCATNLLMLRLFFRGVRLSGYDQSRIQTGMARYVEMFVWQQ